MSCTPVPRTGAAPTSSAIASSASASAASPAPPPLATRFVRVMEDECAVAPRVEDLGTRTLLISPNRVCIVEPGQACAEATDASAGLPSGRGSGWLFTTNPVVLQIERQPHKSSMFQASESDYARFLLDGTRWVPLTQNFGAYPIALPVASGSVVVGWTYEPIGDRDHVPAGNMTRAWLLTAAGAVSEFSRWPHAMTWQHHSTPHTLWATAARPGQPGQFLLRVPLDGAVEWSRIPGVSRCRGVDRLTELALLDEVTDTVAKLRIWSAPECISKQAEGSYRFEHSRWVREGDVTPIVDRPAIEQRVTAAGASFVLGDGTVSVLRNGTTERDGLPGVPPGSADRKLDRLQVTAGGREVWATARTGARCAIYRYQWP